MSEKIQLFPARQNVGKDVLTGEWFSPKLAQAMLKTGLWAKTPTPTSQDDISLMVNKAKDEIKADYDNIQLEKERLKKERDELEAMRVELAGKRKTKEV